MKIFADMTESLRCYNLKNILNFGSAWIMILPTIIRTQDTTTTTTRRRTKFDGVHCRHSAPFMFLSTHRYTSSCLKLFKWKLFSPFYINRFTITKNNSYLIGVLRFEGTKFRQNITKL